VRTASAGRRLTLVEGGAADADAENVAALAQPAHPDENVLDNEDEAPIEARSGDAALESGESVATNPSGTPAGLVQPTSPDVGDIEGESPEHTD
jgi:hypothetical protein